MLKKLKEDLIQVYKDGNLNESTIGMIFEEYGKTHINHSSMDDKELAHYSEFEELYQRELDG